MLSLDSATTHLSFLDEPFVLRPTGIDSVAKDSATYTVHLSPFSHALFNAVNFDQDVRSAIPSLLFLCGPHAVPRFVVSVIILSFQRMFW